VALLDQYETAINSLTTGDLDLLSKVLTNPDAVTTPEQRSVAEKLGMKGGFAKAAVNIVTDPTVWVALLLSRRFPTSQYLKGTIPHRMIGDANQFSGMSTVARTVEGFFRGTNVPKVGSLIMQRRMEVMQVGNKIFDKTIVRPNWRNEKDVVAQILEGGNPVGATPELYRLSSEIRTHMNELWGFLHRTHRVTGGFDSPGGITRALAGPLNSTEAPRFLRDYLPHIPLFGPESTIAVSGRDALARFSKNKVGQAISLVGENPAEVWRPTAGGGLSSTQGAFQRFMNRTQGQVFPARLMRRQRMGLKIQAPEAEGFFLTDLDQILQRYIHGVSVNYSLHAPLTALERSTARTFIETATGQVKAIHPTAEPPIVQIINEGLEAAGPLRLRQRTVAGTRRTQEFVDERAMNPNALGALKNLVREYEGRMDTGEILFSNLWNSVRSKVSRSFGRVANPKQLRQAEDAIGIFERQARDRKMTGRLTSFFYSTTLGINPSPMIKNLFQPVLTTAPTLGIGSTVAGYKVLKQRMSLYADDVVKQARLLKANPDIPFTQRMNTATQRAFENVFPELNRSGLRIDPRAFELSEADVIRDQLTGRMAFKDPNRYFKFLLQPFQHSELSNQVVTFFGGKEALKRAIRTGELDVPISLATKQPLVGQELDAFLNLESSSLVNALQFRPGPGSRTVLQSAIPAPFRMFTSFPIRLANHFADSTVRGALTDAQLREAGFLERALGRGRNWGTIARTVAIGRALTVGLRDSLGVDMSDALGVTGPFSGIVESGRIFSPMMMSPLPSVVHGIASFTSTRDLKDLNPLTLPVVGDIPVPKVLVPGGVGISRAVRALQSFKPDMGGFVDEDERLMYRGDVPDVALSMLGIPLEKDRRLREQMDRVQANRLAVRRRRRNFSVAWRNMDTKEMARQEKLFAQEFPELGTLSVTRHDLRRYYEQSRLTAAQRMIRSLGNRFGFLETDLYEYDPELVAGPTSVESLLEQMD
jgi:hypothetical protein